MTHYTTRRSILILFGVLLSSACQRPSLNRAESVSASSDCQIIKHDLGETRVCGQPHRIIALDPQSLDLLLALGVEPIGYAEDRRALLGSPEAGKSIVGVKYLGDRLTTNPIHIGVSQTPSLEAILILKPNLILGSHLGNTEYQILNKIAPTLLPLHLEAPDRWRTRIQIIGRVLQREEIASAVLAAHDRCTSSTKANLAAHQGKSILLLSMSGLDYIEVFNQNSFAGKLLEDIGFTLFVPAHLGLANEEIVISPEILPQLKPDIIIVMASGSSKVEQIQQIWEKNPILRSLPAYQGNQVYFVDYQLWSRITGSIAAELILKEIQKFLLPTKAINN